MKFCPHSVPPPYLVSVVHTPHLHIVLLYHVRTCDGATRSISLAICGLVA